MADELELTGQRFGCLVALKKLRRSRHGNIWLCRCDCGAITERAAGTLTYRQKLGTDQKCAPCARQAGIDHEERRRALRTSQYSQRFREYGTLYSFDEERAETASLARAAGISPGKAIAQAQRDLLCGFVTAWPKGYR